MNDGFGQIRRIKISETVTFWYRKRQFCQHQRFIFIADEIYTFGKRIRTEQKTLTQLIVLVEQFFIIRIMRLPEYRNLFEQFDIFGETVYFIEQLII